MAKMAFGEETAKVREEGKEAVLKPFTHTEWVLSPAVWPLSHSYTHCDAHYDH